MEIVRPAFAETVRESLGYFFCISAMLLIFPFFILLGSLAFVAPLRILAAFGVYSHSLTETPAEKVGAHAGELSPDTFTT